MVYRLTFVEDEQISDVLKQHMQAPEKRLAQKLLADNLVSLIHGADSL